MADPSLFPMRQGLFHVAPPCVRPGEVFIITSCTLPRGINQLARLQTIGVMTTAWEHYVRSKRLWVSLFLAMPDHIHGLFSFPAGERTEKIMRDWKRFIAKQTDVTWQHGFFDHRLRNDESYGHKAEYIRQNPVRAGLVKAAGDWPYCWKPRDQ